MKIKYDINVSCEMIEKNFNRLTNLVYKLLPQREEGTEWEKSLDSLIQEFTGFFELISDCFLFLSFLSKLEGLKKLKSEEDFPLFRRSIFDCLSLLERMKKEICLDMKN